MSFWGSYWGSGGAGADAECGDSGTLGVSPLASFVLGQSRVDACHDSLLANNDRARARYLYVNRDVPTLAAIADIIDTRWKRIFALLDVLIGLFDVDTAFGEQLDFIGSLVGMPRGGFSDCSRYRRAIKAQIEIILSGSGTRSSLIAVWEQWTGGSVYAYSTIPRNEVEISGPFAFADEAQLSKFIEAARPAGVRVGALSFFADDVLLCDYEGAALTDAGITDYETSEIAGAELTAWSI